MQEEIGKELCQFVVHSVETGVGRPSLPVAASLSLLLPGSHRVYTHLKGTGLQLTYGKKTDSEFYENIQYMYRGSKYTCKTLKLGNLCKPHKLRNTRASVLTMLALLDTRAADVRRGETDENPCEPALKAIFLVSLWNQCHGRVVFKQRGNCKNNIIGILVNAHRQLGPCDGELKINMH